MIYVTPGHTDGTLSFTFPSRITAGADDRLLRRHGLQFPAQVPRFQAYIDTQKRFAKIAADAAPRSCCRTIRSSTRVT
jgi:hypothetical protein